MGRDPAIDPTGAPAGAEPVWLDERCWYTWQPDWIAPELADALLVELLDAPDWIQRPIVVFGREVMQPRLMAWGGDVAYRYSGQTLEPRPLTPSLEALRQRLVAECGVDFNHVILNLYRDGRDSVAMHADNEPELGGEPVIASLSLGAQRRFQFQHRRLRKRRKQLSLTHGGLMVMGGSTQRRWRHAVPKQASVTEPRVNLTFRLLHGPPGWRDPRWRRRPDDTSE